MLLLGAGLPAAVACTPAPVRPPVVASRPASQPAPPASRPLQRPHASAQAAPLRVLWGRVTTTKDCFTFSGPPASKARKELGGKVALVVRGSAMVLSFGAARFVGTLQGDQARLLRRGRYQHRSSWTTTEQITLQREPIDPRDIHPGPRWRGRYSYEECDTSGREGCPSRCTTEAALQLE